MRIGRRRPTVKDNYRGRLQSRRARHYRRRRVTRRRNDKRRAGNTARRRLGALVDAIGTGLAPLLHDGAHVRHFGHLQRHVVRPNDGHAHAHHHEDGEEHNEDMSQRPALSTKWIIASICVESKAELARPPMAKSLRRSAPDLSLRIAAPAIPTMWRSLRQGPTPHHRVTSADSAGSRQFASRAYVRRNYPGPILRRRLARGLSTGAGGGISERRFRAGSGRDLRPPGARYRRRFARWLRNRPPMRRDSRWSLCAGLRRAAACAR